MGRKPRQICRCNQLFISGLDSSQRRFLMPSVSLFVCLLATLRKMYWMVLHENFATWISTNWLDFGSHLGLVLGIFLKDFEGCFNVVRWGVLPQFGLNLWKVRLDLRWNFPANTTLDKEDPVECRKSSGSGFRTRIWTPDLEQICLGRDFAISKCCCFVIDSIVYILSAIWLQIALNDLYHVAYFNCNK